MDEGERARRRQVDKPKPSTKHPIAAIEKRAIDSLAFADLSPSAIVVLLLLARNLTKGGNGHVFVSADDSEAHGINRKTLYRALIELQTHGFIFPTKRGGNGVCARYALTWLPLSRDRAGLRVDNFNPCAWRDWTPAPKKKRVVKMSTHSRQIYPSATETMDKKGTSGRTNLPTLNSIPYTNTKDWIPQYLTELERRGLAGEQCFEIPPRVLQ